MRAIILASGKGERLYPLTKNTPKSLLRIKNKEILGLQIESLVDCRIRDIVITTGPFENKIKKYVKNNYPSVNVFYVNNPKYDSTNYIYSMWLTKNFINDDIILLHGDLLFEKKLLKRLTTGKVNHVLVNKKIKPPKKDFKAIIENEKVIKIGTKFFGKNAFACFPMYKFSRKDFLFWLDEIEKYIKKREVNIYAENVFNEISDKILLYPIYFDDEMCMEIDTEEDLRKAAQIIKGEEKWMKKRLLKY